MTKLLIAVMLSAFSTLSFAEEVTCTVNVNAETVIETTVNVEANAKVEYGRAESYYFYVKNKGKGAFELEIYEYYGPSRSYAEGNLKSEDDKLAWTLWSREILLETSCKLADQ